jgi:Rrf2 family protein
LTATRRLRAQYFTTIIWGGTTEISRRTDYAIRILVELAGRGGGGRLSARRLGEALEIPYPFARRIVTQLAAAGFVDTRRGVGGGVGLARPAADISLRDIVCSLDGSISLNECTRTPGFCSRSAECPVHEAWLEADGVLDRFLEAKDLASMAAAANGEPHTAAGTSKGAGGQQT